ncbi:hypothetical protein C0992_009676 [Termitomyces sp. T32_za158]|nr:hypothetical protein C0992_009676 [Termitomyces sp. T32_za158]
MRLLSLSSYSQCRRTLLRAPAGSWTTLVSLSLRRHRSGGSPRPNPRPRSDEGSRKPISPGPLLADANITPPYRIPKVDPNNIVPFFEDQVQYWSSLQWLPQRLQDFGIPPEEVRPLVTAFVCAVTSGELSTREEHHKYVLSRFAQVDDEDRLHHIDVLYTTILFCWASQPEQVQRLQSAGLSTDTVYRIQALVDAADLSFPAEEFTTARKLHRKFIMHVGPTNSGKTHNALRALAAANTGVYAGPLRLLAHEIWERLNRGQIIPAGIEEEENVITDDTDSALDVAVAHKQENLKYARACNMHTGEEHRIVEDSAPLSACTVEMLDTVRHYDVAVIDEIQMIGDSERGNAWTTAVLGVCAKEIHLCGEETAVPVIQALLKETGDELVVQRYERLSPLYVQEETLNGDWSKVQKGDCIVTFSRGNIFKLKREIEKKTPFRCAVVYGRLPPEIRSEQAALFNDPDSGYDILIGSDAVGMGLNLKIRRVIFQATSKYTGVREAALSISQTKQIAGRAGRYGLHGKDSPGGYVTSLLPESIAHIQEALDAPPQPLSVAYVGVGSRRFQKLSHALPPDSSPQTILAASYYISCLPIYLRHEDMLKKKYHLVCQQLVDTHIDAMTAQDISMFLLSPLPVHDEAASQIVKRFFQAYQEKMSVDLWECMSDSPLVANLDAIERLQTEGKTKGITSVKLQQLESLHKAMVLYLWVCFRRPVSWHSLEDVIALKERLEKALDWALQAMTKLQPGRDSESDLRRRREEKDKLTYLHGFEERLVRAQLRGDS